MRLALVGATGAVGTVILSILEERGFEVDELVPIASPRSEGRKLFWRGETAVVRAISPEVFDGVDIALFDVPDELSLEWAPIAVARGVVVIDNSAAWRMDPDVPLVVPEINPGAIVSRPKGIIASPNCTTLAMIVPLAALHRVAGLRRVIASSYQAASGSGKGGTDELLDQVDLVAKDREVAQSGLTRELLEAGDIFSHPIAMNVIPQCGSFKEGGFTSEELKLCYETRKIMDLPDLAVTATCVRVPVVTGHGVAVHAEFDRPLSVEEAHDILRSAPGTELVDDPGTSVFPTPLEAAGRDACYVGRIRKDPFDPNALEMFCVSDNLRKGAALNTVQVAELIKSVSAIPPLLDDLGFGRLLDSIRDAVIVAEAASEKIVLWNPAAEKLFGYTADEAIGMLIEELVPPELKPSHRAGLRNYAEGLEGPLIGAGTGIELPSLHKTGRTVYVELVLTPIESGSRRGRFVMAILRDVTERHVAEEALLASSKRLQEALDQEQAANEKLVALDTLKNDFIAIVAHDLRSPMSVISGFAQTLVESWDDFTDPVKRDFMARIASSVDNLSQLVEDVLQVARLEGGEFTYEREPFDLAALVRRTVDEVAVGAPDHRFDVVASDDLPFAVADEQRTWQILMNLLSNSVKFSEPDSLVTASVTVSRASLEVSIRDEGVGIAKTDQSRAFDKFSRIHPKGMRKPKGTGLGLYICRSMVDAQGGEISMVSEVGEGTTITFSLPTAAGS